MSLFEKKEPPSTHRLYRVRAKITLDIPVVAPSAEIAAAPEVLSESLPYLLEDLESIHEFENDITVELGEAHLVTAKEELPAAYRSALPYEHPDHPTDVDIECYKWL